MFPRLAALGASIAALALAVPDANAEETTESRSGYWSLTLTGGADFPLSSYADTHQEGLGAHTALAYTGSSGLGIGVVAAYSPLPAVELEADVSRDNHVVHAALAPRFTVGGGTLRLVLGGGGGVFFEQTTERSTTDESVTRTTAPAALAHAGLELHVLGAGGLTVGGTYVRSFKNAKAELAAAHAGFVMTF